MSLGKSTRHLFHKAVRNIFMSGGLGTLEKLCVFYFVRPKITVVMTILTGRRAHSVTTSWCEVGSIRKLAYGFLQTPLVSFFLII